MLTARDMKHTEDLHRSVGTLRGQRIKLRPFTEEDLPRRASWVANEEVSFLMTGRHPDREDVDVDLWWECHQENPYTAVIAIEDEAGRVIGAVDLFVENLKQKSYGLYILIGDRAKWGKGYGSEALMTLLRFCFDELRASTMLLNVFEFNRRAVRCYEKCGFGVVSSVEQAFEHGGQRWRWLTMGCSPASFLRAASRGPTAPSEAVG